MLVYLQKIMEMLHRYGLVLYFFEERVTYMPKGCYTLSVKLSDFTCDVTPEGKTE
jgi:hypothetical protein